MSSKPGTITCVLCGGTHMYPGPRFLNHLIHSHGVLQNLEYIIQVTKYKDSYSRLPPMKQETSKPSNNQTTQTEEVLPSSQGTTCHTPIDSFLTSTPIRQNRSQFLNAASQPFSTPSRSSSVFSHIQHQQAQELIPLEIASDKVEVNDSDASVLPVRSGFRCECALCSWVTHDDTTFWTHITQHHKMNFKKYKAEHGLCQVPTGSGKFECQICQKVMKHMLGSIDKHLKGSHQMNWNKYLDLVREDSIKSVQQQHDELKTEVSFVDEKVVEESQPLKPSEQIVNNSKPMNIRDKTTKHCTHCKIIFPTRNLFLVHCQQVHKLRFKSKSGGSLSFQQHGSRTEVGINKSSRQFPKKSSLSLPSSSWNHQKSLFSSQTGKMSSSKIKSCSCRYCHKEFANVSNRDRHVRLVCKGTDGNGQ